jgi:hypothetical protein
MYVYCVYPAMSKKSENLSDLDKKDRNKPSQLEWMSFPKFKKNHFLHYVHCTCMYILQEIFFLTLYDPRSDSLQMTAYVCQIYIQYTYIVGKYKIYLYEL